ncbi:IspD/TarI family cytidylyltransferase, partial [Streptococcus anginosus]
FNLTKVKAVVAGGETGQMSIFKGLEAAEQLATDDAVVLIHDGVRPLINEEVINANIQSVKETGSAVTSVRAKETVVLVNDSSKIS